MEVLYWLAVLLGKPFTATRETLLATDRIEEGWIVVNRGWFGGSGNALDTRFFAFSTTQWSYKTHRNTLGPMP